MKTWERAAWPTACGGCGRLLEAGDPLFVLTIERGTLTSIRRLRCDTCEGPAPPDLPPFIERTSPITPTPLTRFAPVLPLGMPLADWKARATDEREPGEEG